MSLKRPWFEYKTDKMKDFSLFSDESNNGTIPKLTCCLCNHSCTGDNSSKYHMNYHIFQKSNYCTQCSLGFNSNEDLLTHVQNHKSESLEFQCPECKNTFNSRDSLENHILSHGKSLQKSNTEVEYPESNNECNSANDLDNHVMYSEENSSSSEDDELETFECSLCDYIALSEEDIQEHSLICNGISDSYEKNLTDPQENDTTLLNIGSKTNKKLKNESETAIVGFESCINKDKKVCKKGSESESVRDKLPNLTNKLYENCSISSLNNLNGTNSNIPMVNNQVSTECFGIKADNGQDRTKYISDVINETKLAKSNSDVNKKNKETLGFSKLTEKQSLIKANSRKSKIENVIKKIHGKKKSKIKVETVIVETSMYLTLNEIKKLLKPCKRKKNKEIEVSNPNVYVPEGWRRIVVERSSDKRASMSYSKFFDVYYFSPDGKKHRSKFEILNYLTQPSASVTGEIINLDRLSFGFKGVARKDTTSQYTCSECEYRTTDFHQMKLHLMCHTFKNDFICSECSYTSFRKDHLYAHMKTHVVTYVYYCNTCDYTSKHKFRFQTHKRGHESDDSKMANIKSPNGEGKYSTSNTTETSDVDNVLQSRDAYKSDTNYSSKSNSNSTLDNLDNTSNDLNSTSNNLNDIANDSNNTPSDSNYTNSTMPVSSTTTTNCVVIPGKSNNDIGVSLVTTFSSTNNTGSKVDTVRTIPFSKKKSHINVKHKYYDSSKDVINVINNSNSKSCSLDDDDDGMDGSNNSAIMEKDSRNNSEQNVKKPLFVCMECAYGASQWTDLKLHMNKHEKTLGAKCFECNYTTSNKILMEQHLLKHTGVEPFKCKHTGCDYITYVHENFEMHMMEHTSEVQFECPECDYRNTWEHKLLLHMKKYHQQR